MSNNDNSDSDPSFNVPLPSPTPLNTIVPIYSNPNLQLALSPRYEQSPKKKRTKTIASSSSSNPSPKPKPKATKKPDPDAPKITRPCTECGKKFWSWKALFGHMRCHPERQWRGINPPPDHHRVPKRQRSSPIPNWSCMSEEDHQVASYLLMMANATPTQTPPSSSSNSERFECGVCKKVFSSHQALGGHRASHKNVKGCFAITNVSDDPTIITTVATTSCSDQDHQGKMVLFSGNHKCHICSRVFSSGQALGGHMRCHWEKEQETTIVGSGLDLNVPVVQPDLNVPVVQPEPSTSDTAGCSLDLRLGL